MSIRTLSEVISDLPYSLQEQVLSYARSVEVAAPDIVRESGVRATHVHTDALIFIAGLRKLYSIVDSNYWVLDNTGALLERQHAQFSVRVGGADLSRDSQYHRSLVVLRRELIDILSEQNLLPYMLNVPYVEVLRELADER